MPKKIFISYKKEPLSIQEAKALEADLRKEGYVVFLDTKKIGEGTEWQEKIFTEVRTSDVLIVLLQPETVESEWVQRELDLARGAQVSILPIRLGNKEFTDVEIREVQRKLVIEGKQYGTYCSEKYAKEKLTDPEKEDAENKYQTLLQAIEELATETRRNKRKWATQISIDYFQDPAPFEATAHTFTIQNKKHEPVNIHLATGSLTQFENVDVIVNSENDYVQMARFFENQTVSSTIRRAGSYDEFGQLLHDRVQEELDDIVLEKYRQAPVTFKQVLVTSAGHPDSILVTQGIRYIFHAITNQVNMTHNPYRLIPVENPVIIGECVTNCLNMVRRVDAKKMPVFHNNARFARPIPDDPIKTIAFPIFGTGHGGLEISQVVPAMMNAMIEFVRKDEQTKLTDIFLCVFSQSDVRNVKKMMQDVVDIPRP
jgi:O-acetyl-ADP-ribose deacetylase (regulator of RNase III)